MARFGSVLRFLVVSALATSIVSPVSAQYGYDYYPYGVNYYAPYSQRPDTISVDQYRHYQFYPDRVGWPAYQQYYNAGQGVYAANPSTPAQPSAETPNAANYPYSADPYSANNSYSVDPYSGASLNPSEFGLGLNSGTNAPASGVGNAESSASQTGAGPYQTQGYGTGSPAPNTAVPSTSNPYFTGANAAQQGVYNRQYRAPSGQGTVPFSPYMTGRPDTISVDQFHHYQYTPGRVTPKLRYYNAAPPGKLAK